MQIIKPCALATRYYRRKNNIIIKTLLSEYAQVSSLKSRLLPKIVSKTPVQLAKTKVSVQNLNANNLANARQANTVKHIIYSNIFLYYFKQWSTNLLNTLFFKLKNVQFLVNFQNVEFFIAKNEVFDLQLTEFSFEDLPLFRVKKQFYFLSFLLSFALSTYNLNLIVEQLERYLRRIRLKRLFLTQFLNLLAFYKAQNALQALSFLARGTVEKHGRTVTFSRSLGKISLQTYTTLVYYEYIQCWQRYGVFGFHLWLRYPQYL